MNEQPTVSYCGLFGCVQISWKQHHKCTLFFLHIHIYFIYVFTYIFILESWKVWLHGLHNIAGSDPAKSLLHVIPLCFLSTSAVL